MADILPSLKGLGKSGEGWTANCPAHRDRHRSLSIGRGAGRWLVHCHAGCAPEAVVAALGLNMRDLFDDCRRGEGRAIPGGKAATARPPPRPAGLTLAQYAEAKRLPADFLKTSGITELTYEGRPAIRIPYVGEGGETLAVRFRVALDGDRFRWKSGGRPHLYGLNRLAEARAAGQVALVEGESDCHTLWLHGIPALGLPGATNWNEQRDALHLDGIATIYVVIEPDRGGAAVRRWLQRSAMRSRVRLVSLPVKDPSALYLEDEAGFAEQWRLACMVAVPWTTIEEAQHTEERSEAWEKCGALAQKENILAEFDLDLTRLGLVGERRAAKLVYLALVSRLLDRPVSAAVKGPSSGGKSFVVESTLKFFPGEAFYALTAMSERALAYSTEPLKHRHLVIYEAAGMASDFATYLIRSLLSEGRLRYETVEKTGEGMVPRLIEREGPTGLIVTTTSLRLHPENETRLLSLTITDTREQTAAVLRALAGEGVRDEVDFGRWHALQAWVASGPNLVAVPFADRLAQLVPPVATRLRRDFKTVLNLIGAHALLHQASRQKDEAGRVVATVEDYAAVRALVADLVAEGAEATVKPETREVVAAVAKLFGEGKTEVSQTDLRRVIKLDKSAISRRIATAVDAGYLKNLEDKKGRPAKLVPGDPMPDDVEVLPGPKQLCDGALHGCVVDRGDRHPPLPADDPSWSEHADTIQFDGAISCPELERRSAEGRGGVGL